MTKRGVLQHGKTYILPALWGRDDYQPWKDKRKADKDTNKVRTGGRRPSRWNQVDLKMRRTAVCLPHTSCSGAFKYASLRPTSVQEVHPSVH